MYPKNAASPEPIAIGAVVQISDGAVQGSGCTVRIKPIGVAEGDGGGTTAYSTDGIVLYTPTQAETNYTSFILIAKKTGCIPVSITLITTASSTPGTVLLAPTTHTSAVVPTVTTVTNQLTAAQIATGVWQDTTSGDFTVASSIGKTLYIANVAPGGYGGLAIVGSAMTLAANQHVIVDSGTVTTVTNQLTGAAIATAIWQDTTAGDFTTALSVGKSLMNGVTLGTGLTVARCTLADTLTTYTGNTPQTGDTYALANGSSGFAAIYTYLTTNLGLLGASLSAIPKTGFKLASDGLAAVVAWALPSLGTQAKADVNAEADTALVDAKAAYAAAIEAAILDEGDATALLAAIAAKVEDFVLNDGDSRTTLASIATAVWAATTRRLTDGTNIVLAKGVGVTGFNDLSAAQVNTEADTAISDAALATAANLALVKADTAAIKLKTDNLPSDPADASDIAGAFSTVNTTLGTLNTKLGTPAVSVSADIADLPTNSELATALAGADDATLTAVAAVLTKATAIQKLLEADIQIDTGSTPWACVWLENGTGGVGVGVELLRQPLKDVNGGDVTSVNTVIGRSGL